MSKAPRTLSRGEHSKDKVMLFYSRFVARKGMVWSRASGRGRAHGHWTRNRSAKPPQLILCARAQSHDTLLHAEWRWYVDLFGVDCTRLRVFNSVENGAIRHS